MFDPSRRVVCGFSWNSGHELYKNGTCSGIFGAAPELRFKGIGNWNETLREWGYYSNLCKENVIRRRSRMCPQAQRVSVIST